MWGELLAFLLPLLVSNIAQDWEETARTCYFSVLFGVIFQLLGGFSGFANLICYPQAEGDPSQNATERLELFCKVRGVIPLPANGHREVQKYSPEQRMDVSSMHTFLAYPCCYMFFAIFTPLIAYKILVWNVRKNRINRIIDLAQKFRQAVIAKDEMLQEIRVEILINCLKANSGTPLKKNLMTIIVLIWNISYTIWAIGVIYIILNYYNLPLDWLSFSFIPTARSVQRSILEEKWFPVEFICFHKITNMGNQNVNASAVCHIADNQLRSLGLKIVCWSMIAYNIVVLIRAYQVIRRHWTQAGRENVLMCWFDGSQHAPEFLDRKFVSFARGWASDDLMAMFHIERRMDRSTVEKIIQSYYLAYLNDSQV